MNYKNILILMNYEMNYKNIILILMNYGMNYKNILIINEKEL